jgi:hypothetical protein
MNHAEQVTAQRIEAAMAGNPAFKKLDERVYIVKQGSTFVMLNIGALDEERAQVRCIAQLVKGVNMTPELALELLQHNTRLRFGAFAYAEGAQLVLITHSLLGGETLDPEELTSTLADMARLADEHDDDIIARYGGQRMSDLLEASQIGQLFRDPDASAFEK